MRKKGLSLLLSVIMMTILIPAAADGAPDEAGDVKVLKSPRQAVEAIHKRKGSLKSRRNSLLSKSEYREEVERRVIFKNDKAPKNGYGRRNIFYYEAGEYFILEYDNSKDAKKAAERLAKDYPEALVLQDRIVNMDKPVKTLKHNWDSAAPKKEGEEPPTAFDGWKALGLDKLKEASKNWQGGITVGVIDSGINRHHPLFKNRLDKENSINFAIDSEDKGAYDDPPYVRSDGHGTHVSGIIAKATPEQVKIMAIRVFDITGSASLMTITMGIDYAREKKVPVVNMSLGHESPTKEEKDFMNESIKKSLEENTVLCVASGNEYTNVKNSYPASNGITMAIGSMELRKGSTPEDKDYVKSDFSNNGRLLDFVAPGRNIESAHVINVEGKPKDYNYTCIMSGTSMATPYMSAEAAMVKWKHPEYSHWDVYATFQDYAKDIKPEGKDEDTGYGYVDFSSYADDEKFQGKRYQGISAALNVNKTMNDVNKQVEIDTRITKGDGTLSFESTDSGCVQIKDNKMVIKGAGSCEIIATASETDKYRKTRRFIQVYVEKGTQQIKLNKNKIEKKLGDKAFSLSAKVTKGDGKITFVANENDVLEVSEKGKVKIKGTGTADVFAIAGSTKNYNRCVSNPIRIVVSQKKPEKVKGFAVKALRGGKLQSRWKKVKGVSGYEISYSSKKGNFVFLKNTKKTVVLLKNKKLRKGKNYYFAVRAYKIIRGEKIYGKYSEIKKLKMRR